MAYNKPLTELKWFKWALWGSIGTAAFVASVIGIADFTSEDLRVCFTSVCVNEAISRLKFPLAIASLAFPLVALVASHHRSVQTAAQIQRSDTQINEARNIATSNNMQKHLQIFIDRLYEIEKVKGIKFQDKGALYKSIFTEKRIISLLIIQVRCLFIKII